MADILYADDDDLFREMVRAVLEENGDSVRLVTDGAAALAEVRRAQPDLILLDYRMGDPDGFAVCREIKRDSRYGHIPVLILTGEAEIDHRLEGFDAGADDYLAKPFDPRELKARIRALLELSRRGLDRNPSSGLPGGSAIGREFARRLGSGRSFAICYLDLDNFKPFGERFGFAISDAVIGALGDLLNTVAAAGSDVFAGHVGGDDFVLFCDPGDASTHVARLQSMFSERLPSYVPADVAAAGRYTGEDRSGIEREFPLTAISAAILRIPPTYDGTLQTLGETVSQAKERAKRGGSGSVVEIDLAGRGLN